MGGFVKQNTFKPCWNLEIMEFYEYEDQFIDDLSKPEYSHLPEPEFVARWGAYQVTRDPRERVTLQKTHFRYLMKEARRFLWSRLPINDLFNAGFFGLDKAFDGFDPSFDVKFITYAAPAIRRKIMVSVSNESRLIRIPVSQLQGFYRIGRVLEKHVDEEGECLLKKEEILEKARVTESLFEMYQRFTNGSYLSLDYAESGEGDMHDSFEGKSVDGSGIFVEPNSLERSIELEDEAKNLLWVIGEVKRKGWIDDRDIRMLIKREGLDGNDPMTLEEVGEIEGISRERVNQLLRRTRESIIWNLGRPSMRNP